MRDRGGNFAIMAALVLPVLLAAGGVAIDMTNMMFAKNQLQDATDAAALAASSALINDGASIDQAKKIAQDFLKSHTQSTLTADMSPEEAAAFQNAFSANTKVDITAKIDSATFSTSKSYNVEVSTKFSLPLNGMTRLLGQDATEISTSSKSLSASETKSALSMFLVLDRSGSMAEDTGTVNAASPTRSYTYDCSYYSGRRYISKTCTGTETNYITKIDALKNATEGLTQYFKSADPDNKYVRTGAVSYNASMQKQTDMAWGSTAVDKYVKALTATGGTDSSDAFELAYNKLMLTKNGASVEDAAHMASSQQKATKYIIFMTDGDNNQTSADTETKASCKKAKDAGIQVYSVAFMAPPRGESLLKACATSSAHYMAPQDAEELKKAFENIGQKASALTVRLTQ
jgi:Flp pilus assembly protein TadG